MTTKEDKHSNVIPASVMPNEEVLVQLANRSSPLTIKQFTREAIRLWKTNIHYDDTFAREDLPRAVTLDYM